jgi:septum formation protein
VTIERSSPRAAPRFILASGSPRRRQLLEEAGYQFEVIAPPVEEVSHDWFTIRELTVCNAMRKTSHVAKIFPEAVVLGADTLVSLDGHVLGKPAELSAARETLRRLSGQTHEVWTAVCLRHSDLGRSRIFQVVSRVKFHNLTESAITNYFAKVNPLDKAGAYAAQGHGKEIIQRIEGSYSNVVGLPMETTMRVLRALGVTKSRPVVSPPS